MPPIGGRPEHSEETSGGSDRPHVLDDKAREAQAVTRGKRGVSVGHGDFSGEACGGSSSAMHQEVLTPFPRLQRVVTAERLNDAGLLRRPLGRLPR